MASASAVPLFLATTAVTALNTIYFKRMLNCYRSSHNVVAEGGQPHDYAVFVSVFGILLWAVLMTALAWAAGLPSQRFPRLGVLRVAAADQFGTLLATLGATYVPGQAQVLLNQAVLPLTMILSLCLGRRFGMRQIVGAVLVLAGASAAVLRSSSGTTIHEREWLGEGLAVFCLAQVAVATAGLLKEGLLHRPGPQGVNEGNSAAAPVALGVAVAWSRVPLGLTLALIVPQGGVGSLRESNILADLLDGFRCFCGQEPRPGDSACRSAAGITLASVVLYAAQTLLCLRLTQQGSAALRSIAAVTAVPLTQLLFTSERLMSASGAEALGHSSLAGLLLCLVGFFTYVTSPASVPKASTATSN